MPAGDWYDADGDVVNDGRNLYLYDGRGRICAVRNGITGAVTEYVYDAEGNRAAKGTLSSWPSACPAATAANGFTLTTQYIVGIEGEQLSEQAVSGGTSTWTHTNVFAGGALIATYARTSSGSDTYFNLTDWLGTKRAELGADGCLTGWQSLPFGDNTNGSNQIIATQAVSIGSTTPQCLDASEHHFTAKERDSESGNDYFGARYYASTMGRFLSPDWSAKIMPVPCATLSDPQSLNLYAYMRNNPLGGADPDGHCGFDLQCIINIGLGLPKESRETAA